MKKILLATTILSMSAGFAAAEVAVSGDARMGIKSTGSVSSAGVRSSASLLESRVRISFSGSGTTDGGLAFGGSIRADNSGTGASGTAGSAFISGAFGKLSMGDVASGDNKAVGNIASVGFTGLGSGNSVSYSADGGSDEGMPGTYANSVNSAKALYTYTGAGVSAHVSVGQQSTTSANAYGVGVGYTSGPVTIGVGYGVADGGTITGLSAYDTNTYVGVVATAGATNVTAVAAVNSIAVGYYETSSIASSISDMSLSASYVMGDTTVKAIYQNRTIEGSVAARSGTATAAIATGAVHGHAAIALSSTATSMGMSVVQKMGGLTLTGFAIETKLDMDSDLASTDPSVSRSGIGFGYDLGGGATLGGGWANADTLVSTAVTAAGTIGVLQTYTMSSVSAASYDLGVSFSF